VVFTDVLPRNAAGKILKRILRENSIFDFVGTRGILTHGCFRGENFLH
jgi:acyl-CoA synthetase (AMP-forming)/AMP-acid ligase II